MALKKVVKYAAFAALAALAAFWGYRRYAGAGSSQAFYKTAPVERRDIVVAIDATGPVEPEDLVSVGARVSGEILKFGTDIDGKRVDFGSKVRAGDMLAVIDDQIPRSDLLTANAKLAATEAALKEARANLAVAEASRKKAERDWDRAQKVGVGRALSQAEHDAYLSAFESASAQIEASNAAIARAEAEILQAQASVKTAQRNLDYCTIRAPVDGVIIDRLVNVGQTVVSNMSVSSLFSIAKDLKKMEIWASVNEADIGQVKVGQRVEFTVDAFPDEKFCGTVGKIRLNATMSQNVVVYIVEVLIDNSDGNLLPYLTANMKFEISKSEKALSVPNAALKWSPGGAPRRGLKKSVWVLGAGNAPREVAVETGIDDGVYTEIKQGSLSESDRVIVGVESAEAAKAGESNPFLPKPPMRGRKK
ncbi:MAG: efflux RND transporter periplasmic adaptor subunit [Opitutales bacterium]|nr:efflux RND transporter periplasmic adaptor subunit [Opitutales bacterium]